MTPITKTEIQALIKSDTFARHLNSKLHDTIYPDGDIDSDTLPQGYLLHDALILTIIETQNRMPTPEELATIHEIDISKPYQESTAPNRPALKTVNVIDALGRCPSGKLRDIAQIAEVSIGVAQNRIKIAKRDL